MFSIPLFIQKAKGAFPHLLGTGHWTCVLLPALPTPIPIKGGAARLNVSFTIYWQYSLSMSLFPHVKI